MDYKKQKDLLFPILNFTLDCISIELAFLFSYWFRFNSGLSLFYLEHSNIPEIIPYFISSLVVVPIWIFIFYRQGLYSQSSIINTNDYFLKVIKSITLGMSIILSIVFFYRDFSYSRLVFIFIYFSSISFVLIGRTIVRRLQIYYYLNDKYLKKTLIIGNNEKSFFIYDYLYKNKVLGYRIIGYCAEKQILNDHCYLGSIENLRNIIISNEIEVVIALQTDKEDSVLRIIKEAEGLNLEFMFLPNIFEILKNKIKTKIIGGFNFLDLKDFPIGGINYFVKRTFDIFFSLLFLILSLPFSILIILLIKIGSKGPIFYIQERVGLEGKIFRLIKFRSMKIDAENISGPVWAKNGDNRTTKIGNFIRRYSIDEIPQFINVLLGDMSIVGPRPERPFFVDKFKDTIPFYLERHRVKTGITGWAQVNGLRGNTPLEDRINFDIYYIENWSILFDLFIIFKTFKEIIFSKNAY